MKLPLAILALCCAGAQAAEEQEAVSLHGQSTWIWQRKPAMAAAYSGPNSLRPEAEKSYSFTATAALGLRLWSGAEAYFDAELVQGVPLSGLTGLGGLSNGELQKTAGSNPVLYRARAYLRQAWALGDEQEDVESGFNQLGGRQATRRIVLTAGNLAVSDLFDNNRYAHDARTQFLNWGLLTHGAFDFAADSRGYSQGLALEGYSGDWALRGGRFMVPRESNGLALDTRLGQVHGDQVELEHKHQLAGRAGTLRLLAFRNVAVMARFDDALASPGLQLADVRRRQAKQGWGIALEQELTPSLGGFFRAGHHDGRTEPYSFAAIDDAVSAGLVWQQSFGTLGLAWASHGLSPSHRRFLAAGGSDFFLGDGALAYGRERVLEAYWSTELTARLKLSLDLQQIAQPGYNRDRGPARSFALRLHAEM